MLHAAAPALTFGVGIPLNDALARADVHDAAGARADFADGRQAVNITRTLVCMAALGCLARALATRSRTARP